MRVELLSGTGDQWTFRRLPAVLRELDVTPRHVIHVGANLGQEVPDYARAGIRRIDLVEPDPDTAARLRGIVDKLPRDLYPDVRVLKIACGPVAGAGTLRRSDGADVWSTLAVSPLPHGRAVTSEVIVPVVPLSEVQADADMAVIDTQGTELEVLRSADLSRLELVVIETHGTDDPGAHAAPFDATVDHMATQGWAPVWQWMHERQTSRWFATYADTFFMPVR